MRSAASGIWNHSFSPAVNELAPFGAVCACAADTSVAATIRAALRATIDFLNIVVTPAWGSHLVGVRLHVVGMGARRISARRTAKSRAQEIAESKESRVAKGLLASWGGAASNDALVSGLPGFQLRVSCTRVTASIFAQHRSSLVKEPPAVPNACNSAHAIAISPRPPVR